MKSAGIKILDGGMGTELSRQGYSDEDDPLFGARLLHVNPEAVKNVHLSFLRAGAEVITTASYQASLEGFRKELNLDVKASMELIAQSVSLARDACQEYSKECMESRGIGVSPKLLVAGSVGPRGAALADGSEYTGDYVNSMTLEELQSWHRPRMACLVQQGVDLLAMETQPTQLEAQALVRLLREFPSTKAWVSFSCKDSQHTCHGEKLDDAISCCLKEDNSRQIVGIGVNCTSPSNVLPLLQCAEKARGTVPFVIYPNSGEKWDADKKWSKKECCPPVVSFIHDWITNHQVAWIGGCCRVLPEEITEIRNKVETLVAK